MIEKVFVLLIFGAVGLGIEVIFTSASALFNKDERDRVRLFGYSSLWYLPLYAFALPLGMYYVQSGVGDFPLIVRGIIYAFLCQAGEFIAMGALHLLNGKSPSEADYLKSNRSIYGFTRWDFFPAFILLGLIFEYLVRHLLV